jgi:hypothetical protein
MDIGFEDKTAGSNIKLVEPHIGLENNLDARINYFIRGG